MEGPELPQGFSGYAGRVKPPSSTGVPVPPVDLPGGEDAGVASKDDEAAQAETAAPLDKEDPMERLERLTTSKERLDGRSLAIRLDSQDSVEGKTARSHFLADGFKPIVLKEADFRTTACSRRKSQASAAGDTGLLETRTGLGCDSEVANILSDSPSPPPKPSGSDRAQGDRNRLNKTGGKQQCDSIGCRTCCRDGRRTCRSSSSTITPSPQRQCGTLSSNEYQDILPTRS
jgi:hypothetical protein